MDIEGILSEASKVLKGKEEVIEKALLCLLSGGHLLIEDVPGTGKTTLALSLARVLGLSFARIQFTSDLMPSDITGVNVFNPKTREFEFKKGPIFHNVILADEINRGTPKTQSALLEAMAERQVSVDGKTYKLPEPFFVIATQNPVEHYGTYPLPEAQLDRFTMRLNVGYPPKEHEIEIVRGINPMERVNELSTVSVAEEVLKATEDVKRIYISEEIGEFIVDFANALRNHPDVLLGISTRGLIHLAQVARAQAFVRGRDFVVPEDVIDNIPYVVPHRLILREGAHAEKVIKECLKTVKVP